MPVKQQKILHNLIARNREELTTDEKKQLDEMMEDYEIALLRKAEASHVAVERGLMKPL